MRRKTANGGERKKAPSEEGAIRGRTVESLCVGAGMTGARRVGYFLRAGALRAGRLAFLRAAAFVFFAAAGAALPLPVTLS